MSVEEKKCLKILPDSKSTCEFWQQHDGVCGRLTLDANICTQLNCIRTANHSKPHTDRTGYSWDSETAPPAKKTKGEILEIANQVIHGEKREAYGSVLKSFSNAARKWSVTLGMDVTPEQVALCMIDLKTCRELNKHGEDNLVDICGYAALIQELKG